MVFDNTSKAEAGQVKCQECGSVVTIGEAAKAHATSHWGTNPNLNPNDLRGEARKRYDALVGAK